MRKFGWPAGGAQLTFILACIIFACPATSRAQLAGAASSVGISSSAPAELSDNPCMAGTAQPRFPAVSQPPSASSSDEGRQTKRILGIMPNFRSVSANSQLPPQTPKEKLRDVADDSFDYSSFVFVGLLSGVTQMQNSTPEFHQGVAGFGRYYWHNFADQTDENFWVGFILPVALRQDARYYTLGGETTAGHNGFLKRTGYAFSRILVTRTDSGGSSFNFSEVVGAGAAAGISNFYYPSPERTWTKTGQRWALNAGIDGGTFIFKEFWPDINRAIFHNK